MYFVNFRRKEKGENLVNPYLDLQVFQEGRGVMDVR